MSISPKDWKEFYQNHSIKEKRGGKGRKVDYNLFVLFFEFKELKGIY